MIGCRPPRIVMNSRRLIASPEAQDKLYCLPFRTHRHQSLFYAPHRLLRTRRKGPRHRAAEKRDELASLHVHAVKTAPCAVAKA